LLRDPNLRGKPMCMHAFLILDDSLKLPTSLSIFDAYIAESRNYKT
jgi:hypothetical protein